MKPFPVCELEKTILTLFRQRKPALYDYPEHSAEL